MRWWIKYSQMNRITLECVSEIQSTYDVKFYLAFLYNKRLDKRNKKVFDRVAVCGPKS